MQNAWAGMHHESIVLSFKFLYAFSVQLQNDFASDGADKKMRSKLNNGWSETLEEKVRSVYFILFASYNRRFGK